MRRSKFLRQARSAFDQCTATARPYPVTIRGYRSMTIAAMVWRSGGTSSGYVTFWNAILDPLSPHAAGPCQQQAHRSQGM